MLLLEVVVASNEVTTMLQQLKVTTTAAIRSLIYSELSYSL